MGCAIDRRGIKESWLGISHQMRAAAALPEHQVRIKKKD